MMRTLVLFLSVAFSTLLATSSEASIVITMENKSAQTFTSGSTTTLDVFLNVTNSDSIFSFNYALSITGATGGSGALQFAGSQSRAEQKFANYVFFPNVPVAANDFGQMLQVTGAPPTTLTGSDQVTGAFVFNPLVTGQTYLLARLDLQHTGPLTTSPSTFTVSVTSFGGKEDSSGASLTGPISIAGASTTLTFANPVAAVPEPSSLACVGLVVAAFARFRRRLKLRSRQNNLPPSTSF